MPTPTPPRGRAPRRPSDAAMPGWVYGFVIAFALVLAVFVIVHLTGLMPMHHGMR